MRRKRYTQQLLFATEETQEGATFRCPAHGLVTLSAKEYRAQLDQWPPDPWLCPACGEMAEVVDSPTYRERISV